jgi:hypothetical protein
MAVRSRSWTTGMGGWTIPHRIPLRGRFPHEADGRSWSLYPEGGHAYSGNRTLKRAGLPGTSMHRVCSEPPVSALIPKVASPLHEGDVGKAVVATDTASANADRDNGGCGLSCCGPWGTGGDQGRHLTTVRRRRRRGRGELASTSEALKTRAIAGSVCKEVEPSLQIASTLNLPSAEPSISALLKPGCSQSVCRDPGRHVLRFEVV